MKFISKSICTLILVMSVHFAYSQEFRASDQLPIDKDIKIGKLENGLTYYIKKSQNPANRAEFFIIHNVGSLQEENNQRGLAHFLEHMAFNGTKNYPKKKLLEYFASIGVKFGANINAYTSMDRTVYNVSSVPMLRPSIIDSALLVLHDWSYYISCQLKEIEAERGVIREEWRRGDDARTRMMKAINKYLQTGSRFADRDVIGLPEIINTFEPKTLVDYYHKWYRPDLQAIVIVGDVDVNDIENRVKKIFSTIPKAKNPAKRETYEIPDNKEPIIGYVTDPESKGYSSRIVIKYPNISAQAKQTKELIYDELMQNLFLELVKARCDAASTSKDSLLKAAIPALGSISYAMRSFTITALPIGNRMADASKAVAMEVERIAQHGFGEEEFQTALKIVKKQVETNYKRVKDPKNVDIVSNIVEHFTRNEPLVSVEDRYTLAKECIKTIQLADINYYYPKIIRPDNRLLIFACPAKDSAFLPSKENCLKMLNTVRNTKLDMFIPNGEKELAFNSTLVAKAITSEKKLSNFDNATEFTLSNGIKVIWKETSKVGEPVKFFAFKKGGFSLGEDNDIFETKFMERFSSQFIVGGLNRQEMTKWLNNKSISLKPSISYRYDEMSGSFSQKSTDDFFKLLYSYFNSVSIDNNDINTAKTQLLKDLDQPRDSHQNYRDSCQALQYSYDPLYPRYTKEFVKGISSQNILNRYKVHFFMPCQFTYVFSGPMSLEKAKPFLEKYLSNLSNQNEVDSKFTFREPKINNGEISLQYKGENLISSKASVYRLYSGKIAYTTENYVKAKYLVYILRERYMKSIREEKGGTYHVGVSVNTVKDPENLMQIAVEFDTDPKLVEELLVIVQNEIENLQKNGPTEKEIKEVTLYLQKDSEEKKKEDKEWATIIKNTFQNNLPIQEGDDKFVGKFGASDLKIFAKTLLGQKNRITFVFAPASKK